MERPKSFQWTGEPRTGAKQNVVPIAPGQKTGNFPFPSFQPIRFRLRDLAAAALAISVLSALGITLWISSLDIGKLAIPVSAPTKLMDVHGKAVAEISAVKNEPVTMGQIPTAMRQAIVAVEDRRFYKHTGVDVSGILRAVFRNAKEGETTEGGSTITQQLAKNVFLSPDRTFKRKMTEAAYAIKRKRRT